MKWLSMLAAISLATAPTAAFAQDREVPYWASIRWEEVNMRVGPSESFPISWVYKRPGLPLKVVRVVEGWRLVQDPDGEQGWVIARSLRLDRGAIVSGEGLAEMRSEAGGGRMLWKVEPGVTGALGKCEDGWCEFDVAGKRGFIKSARLWGSEELSPE